MSGGGGGGGNNQQQAPAPAGTPMQTIQPGMPGQISTLADQLAAGFGQNPADMLSQLQQYYQPMSIPNYAPVATTPSTPNAHGPTPTTNTPPVLGRDNKLVRDNSGYNPVRQGGANR